jgi:hypothetical protein
VHRDEKENVMNVSRKWIVFGTAAVLGVGGAVTAASLGVNDAPDRDAAAVMLQTEPTDTVDATAGDPVADVDDSPESADSPNASAIDSAESASDSPDDPGYTGGATGSDDSAASPVSPGIVEQDSNDSAASANN